MRTRIEKRRALQKVADRPDFEPWALRIHEPKAGKLDFDRFPFQAEWYATGGTLRELVIKKATQVGASAFLVRESLYWADSMGLTVMYLFPKASQVFDFSDTRVQTLLDSSPYLRGRVAGASVQSKGLKQIGQGFLYFRGSESITGLESVDADALLLDEYDYLMPANLPIVERRLSGSQHAFRRRIGVPTVPGFGMDALYKQTDMRHWHVRCDSCRRHQPIFFTPGHEEADGEVNGYVDQEALRVVCGKCHKPLDVAKGEWVAKFPDRTLRGYHASRLIVPAFARNERDTLEAIVKASKNTSPFEVQTFYNRDLGEAYATSEGRLSLEVLQAAQREGLFQLTGYAGPNLVTAGIDVASVRALNVKISEHLLDRTKRTLWLGQCQDFDEVEQKLAEFRVHMFAIDHLPEGRLATALVERHAGRGYRVALTGSQQAQIMSVKEDERLAVVRRTEAIDATMSMIRAQRNLLPQDLPEGYVAHMQAPVRFYEKDAVGKTVVGYRSSGPDDYMMCELYDLVAKELWTYRQTLNQYEGEISELSDRLEFQRAHLGDPEEADKTGYSPGPGEGDYSPGFGEGEDGLPGGETWWDE